jgi:acetate kinase
MKILVLNSGSSSIKYAVFKFPEQTLLLSGLLEQIGEPLAQHSYHFLSTVGEQHVKQQLNIPDHQEGLNCIREVLLHSGLLTDFKELFCIGHRVVHGGELFTQPTLVTPEVIVQIKAMIPLAPLHNPANLLGIEVALQLAESVPQVAVFDTAFHQTLPDYAYRYPVPAVLYDELKLRRYGFHGTSHQYLAQKAALLLNKPLSELNLITLHLGNGASACAIEKGVSVDTSMGLTPLEGLMMGTRCGDIDAMVYDYLHRVKGWSLTEISQILNKNSGLKGVSGSNDMREVAKRAAQGDADAQLARQMFVYRIKKYIGAYYAVLGSVDAIIFSGGIGEHDEQLRIEVCKNMETLGINIDCEKNANLAIYDGKTHPTERTVAVLVIPTHEELAIALHAVSCCASFSAIEK